MLIHNKDDIQFVTEFPCFLGHPVPNFKSHNINMSARVYFMKNVKDCKGVSIMSLYKYKYNRMQLKHKQVKCEHSRYHNTKSKTISNSSLNSHVYWDTLYIL